MARKIISPCMDCEWRSVGCHSHCELYANFKTELEKYKQYLREKERYIHINYHEQMKERERKRRFR